MALQNECQTKNIPIEIIDNTENKKDLEQILV